MLRVVHACDQLWFHGRADPFPDLVSVSARLTGFVACRMACGRRSTRNTSATSRLVLGLGRTLTLQLNLSRIKETDDQVPDRHGNFFYYTRTVSETALSTTQPPSPQAPSARRHTLLHGLRLQDCTHY